MSLYAGIHVNDGSIPVAMCIFIKLWSPKKGLRKPPYKLQAARLCKTIESIKQVEE